MDRISQLKNFLAETPQDPFLHFALAKEYEKEGQTDLAVERYEYLIQEHHTYVGTYYHAGKIHEKLENYSRALACYDQGLEEARKAGDRHSAGELAEARELLLDQM